MDQLPQHVFFLTQQPLAHDEEPPARVQIALRYLLQCSAKTAPRVAVNDISIERLDGDDLTIREQETASAACNCLRNYFLGKLPMND